MKRIMMTTAVAALTFALCGAAAAEEEKPLVQIAILLDTSGSMSGLINQAKTQLWQIVNQFATAKKNGKQPDIRVALYEYGNDGLSSENGWIRQITELTDDLDKVSGELFKLTTNGGSEYCGMVIDKAVKELKWSRAAGVYKAIFIAGNEPFTQGNVDWRAACKAAVTNGIIVNTIHCAGGEDTGWRDAAMLADGSFHSINQNQQVADVPAPQDTAIARLNAELNATYLAFGDKGRERKALQMEQDEKSVAAGSMAQRALSKSQEFYKNEGWDLVDAAKAKDFRMDKVPAAALPEEMQKMDAEEREEYVKEKSEKRAEIQAQITKLMEERKTYVAEEMKKLSASGETLGAAMMKTVKAQAEKAKFVFEK